MKHFILLVADDLAAAHDMLATLAVSWERLGSNLVNRPSLIWTVGEEFHAEIAALRSSAFLRAVGPETAPRLDDGGALPSGAAAAVSGLTLRCAFTLAPDKTRPQETHALVWRVLFPHQFADYRVGAQQLAGYLQTMREQHGKPDSVAVIALTDAAPLGGPADRAIGSGVDQIVNPLLQARLAGEFGDKSQFVVALSGLERIFAHFFALKRGYGEGPIAALPWGRFETAWAAARDSELMSRLIEILLRDRVHLTNLRLNSEAFAPTSAPKLRYVPILPRGFLAPFGCVNHDAATGAWRIGGPATPLRDEYDCPDVIPYGSCDPLLAAILNEKVATEYRPGAGSAESRRGGSRAARAFF